MTSNQLQPIIAGNNIIINNINITTTLPFIGKKLAPYL